MPEFMTVSNNRVHVDARHVAAVLEQKGGNTRLILDNADTFSLVDSYEDVIKKLKGIS